MAKGRLSEPREGLSLAAVTEKRAIHIRKAVQCLMRGIKDNRLLNSFSAIFGPRWQLDLGSPSEIHSIRSRAAWNLVCAWLLAHSSGTISPFASLKEGEDWFIGDTRIPAPRITSLIPAEKLDEAQRELQKVSIDQDFWDLFPYVLEEHGPGSRSSVLRDPDTRAARLAKKRHGVFYTPSDVADYMTDGALANYPLNPTHATCFDPSCGTGVFLLSLCRRSERRTNGEHFDRFSYIVHNLYGCDISAHAIDACTFVLLQHCLLDVYCYGITPWAAWHAIRLNLAVLDSLTLTSSKPRLTSSKKMRQEKRLALLNRRSDWMECYKEGVKHPMDQCPSLALFSNNRMVGIGELFTEVGEGFNILVGNPPYSSLGKRPDFDLLSTEYECLAKTRPSPRHNMFLLFVEMMWRLTFSGQNSSAIVTPLSVAYNHDPQYRDCRRAMGWHGGHWQFAFFDREPHALFGEEVKTRNAVLFRFENNSTPSRDEPAEIETGNLLKWTSRTRKQLFESIGFTSLGTQDIVPAIPKVGGPSQVAVYAILKRRPKLFQSFSRKIGSCSLESALNPSQTGNRVFIGGTGYNFLNVFRAFSPNDVSEFPLSESPIHCIDFVSEADAGMGFAILSSRVVFWLWRIEADGFHVPSWFIHTIPFSRESFSHEQTKQLIRLGTRLWEGVQRHRFSSVNRGRITYTFRPLLLNEERDAIDSILINAFELPPVFLHELKKFVRTIVVVDETDIKRRHLQNYFNEGQDQCQQK